MVPTGIAGDILFLWGSLMLLTTEELIKELELCRGNAHEKDENAGESLHDE